MNRLPNSCCTLLLLVCISLLAGCSASLYTKNMIPVVQLGHTSAVACLAFSPDGEHIISGGDDGVIKLWEVATGREVRSFGNLDAGITALAYSPVAPLALAGYRDGTIALWDATTGDHVRRYSDHGEQIQALAFSGDGSRIYSGDKGRNIIVWETSTAAPIRKIAGDRSKFYNREQLGYDSYYPTTISFSGDGSLAVINSMDVQVWDTERARIITKLPGKAMTGKFGQSITDTDFSPDGRHFITGGNGLEQRDSETGSLVRSFSGKTHGILALDHSPDGKHVIAGYRDKAMVLWEIDGGIELHSFVPAKEPIQELAFSPNGSFVLAALADGTLTLWDVSTGKVVQRFKGASSKVNAMAGGTAGPHMMSGSENGSLALWDMSEGTAVALFRGHREAVTAVAFLPDKPQALSGSEDRSIRLWDLDSGMRVKTLRGHRDAVTSLAVSSDGTFTVSGSKDMTCRIWNIGTGEELKTLEGHTHWVNDVAISPDGLKVLSGSSDQSARIWDVRTGKELSVFKTNLGWVMSVAFSPDGRSVLTGSWQHITLWDVGTGMKKWSRKAHRGNVTGVAFSPDGAYVLSASDDGTINLSRGSTGGFITGYTGHLAGVNEIGFSADGTQAYSVSDDATARVWNVSGGQEITRMVSSGDNEWLIVTPDGYYHTSPEGGGLLHWTSPGSMETFTYEQFESSFNRPEIIRERLGVDLQAGYPAPEMTRPPRVSMAQHLTIVETDAKNYTVSVGASAAKEVQTIRVYANGRPVREMAVRQRRASIDLDIPLSRGANRITVVAYDEKGFSSNPRYLDVITEHPELSRPDLHLLAVGISDYPALPARWQLNFAHSDALALARSLKGQESNFFSRVHQNILINEDASRSSIIDALKAMEAISANDIALIFLAGHGIREDDGSFFFLTSDAAPSRLAETGIDWPILQSALANIKGRVILILDACHSGSIVTETVVPNDELAHQFFSRGGGTMVFSASKGRQYSIESPRHRRRQWPVHLCSGPESRAMVGGGGQKQE